MADGGVTYNDMAEMIKTDIKKSQQTLIDKIDILVTVGFRARDIAEGALDAGMPEQNILQFEDAQKAGEELAAMLQSGDCILVKGSQSMRMERTVKELMASPERASQILVRQDEEWIKR